MQTNSNPLEAIVSHNQQFPPLESVTRPTVQQYQQNKRLTIWIEKHRQCAPGHA